MRFVRTLLTPFLPKVSDPGPAREALQRLQQVRAELMATGAEVRRIIDEESREASSGS